MGELFGTDGIRGEANVPPMTPNMALRLGRALAARLGGSASTGRARIVIGKDTRLSGYMFEQALAAGVCSMGADVWLCGPLPTPGIAFITTSMRADAGVVISASHNAYQDNGIKLFGHDGYKIADEHEAEIERLVLGDGLLDQRPTGMGLGRAFRIEESWARYVVFLKSALPVDLELDGMTIVVDCAHGAAYRVAPAVFEELGANVITIGTRPNGTNINLGCGSLYPEKMCAAVKDHGAQLGIALDGDADRVIVADELGNVVDGDQLLAIAAQYMKNQGALAHNTVVATVMSNLGLELFLRGEDIQMIRTAVGDRHVVAEMRRGGYNIGGEQSGHLIFTDHTSTGDGVIAALKTITAMLRSGRPLSELAGAVERVPQVLVNLRVRSKPPLSDLPEVTAAIASVEAELGDEGRVLVRYSGTEPKARVMIEGRDQGQIEGYAEGIADKLRKVIGE